MKEKNEKNGIVTLLLMTAAACFIYMMNSGIRNNFGIMLQAITENTGLTFVLYWLLLSSALELLSRFPGLLLRKEGVVFR